MHRDSALWPTVQGFRVSLSSHLELWFGTPAVRISSLGVAALRDEILISLADFVEHAIWDPLKSYNHFYMYCWTSQIAKICAVTQINANLYIDCNLLCFCLSRLGCRHLYGLWVTRGPSLPATPSVAHSISLDLPELPELFPVSLWDGLFLKP